MTPIIISDPKILIISFLIFLLLMFISIVTGYYQGIKDTRKTIDIGKVGINKF